MLQPKRTKFRKVMTGRNRGLAKGTDVSFGEYGLKSCWPWSHHCSSDRSGSSCNDASR